MNSNEDKEVSNSDVKESIESSSNSKEEETIDDISGNYQFGWSSYSEITNGRFAMLGFLAIILIELLSQKSFLNWTGIL